MAVGDFIFSVKTDNTGGSSTDTQYTLLVYPLEGYTFDFNIDWGIHIQILMLLIL